MTSSYENIYSRFLGKINDYEFANLEVGDAYESMRDWLHSAVADPFIRKLFSSVSFDDEIMTFEFTMLNPIDDDFDLNFVEEVFARSMVIYWLAPKVNTTANIEQFFGGKEQKYYAQSTHLNSLESKLEKEKSELQKYIRNHRYANYVINGS